MSRFGFKAHAECCVKNGLELEQDWKCRDKQEAFSAAPVRDSALNAGSGSREGVCS